MKRILAAALCLLLAWSVCGCGMWDEPPLPTTPTAPTAASRSTVPTVPEPSADLIAPTDPAPLDTIYAIALPVISESVTAGDGTVIFTRSYQNASLILEDSAISDSITADLNSRIQATQTAAADIEAYARDAYDPSGYWFPYFLDVSYTPTRIDRGVLSLFGNNTSFGGGAYPSVATESVTYDMTTGKALTLGDILTVGAWGDELCEKIVESLSAKGTELFYDYETILQDRFSGDYGSMTGWYFSQTGLCFHFAPYDIAPYASGTVIAEIPYEKLTGILLDAYHPAQADPPTGSMYAEMFLPEDVERFSCIADVTLSEGGTRILLHPDANVQDVRIESGSWSADGTKYVPSATVFATDTLDLGHAIVLLADLSETAPTLRLIYRFGDQEASAFIIYDRSGDTVFLAHG